MNRIPEPELMEDAEQVLAYATADFGEANQRFVDGFLAEFDALAAGRVLDLGCGPADILIRLAKTRITEQIVGVDGSHAMLERARVDVEAAGLLQQIRLMKGYIPGLDLAEHSFDVAVSNSLLHHLERPLTFWEEVQRLVRPGGGVYVVDLIRPVSKERAQEIVDNAGASESPVLRADFYNSLLAAFTVEEVADQLRASRLGHLTCRVISERHWAVSGRI